MLKHLISVRSLLISTLLPLQAAAQINRLHLGTNLSSSEVTFRVFSSRATRIEVDLFAQAFGADETARIPLAKDAATNVWTVSVPLDAIRQQYQISGTIFYGYRAWGPNWPFDPAWTKGSGAGFINDVDNDGNRFNPNKLLLDPYAQEISQDPENPKNLDGTVYASGSKYRLKDSGQVAPKGIVLSEAAPARAGHPQSPLKDDIIYEVHVRGLTEADPSIPQQYRGTYRGAGMKAQALKKLGVTAVEFLPLQETQNDSNDVDPASANYWGYATLNYFAPDRRYSSDKSPGGPTRELQAMIEQYHAAGLKVFADVVYNHTGEGYAWDPSDPTTYNIISWRGLDNPTYYLLTNNNQFSYDNTGTGGDYNTANPVAQDLIVDSLAYWHDSLGVDGFRFDLAPVLGNTCTQGCFNYDKMAPATALNRVAREFPGVPLMAEPWAASGSGFYQLGNFPAGWSEWNGAYRDKIRQSQNELGQQSFTTADLATRFAGSSDLFQNNGRKPWNSINFVVVHDGFTLADLYRYTADNNSWDQGGNPQAQMQAARTGLALVMLSAGTPLMTGGDEFLRSLGGNENPYNIDTALNWLNYNLNDGQKTFESFAESVIAFRKNHPALRPADFYTSDQVSWFQPSGGVADSNYFTNPDNHAIGWEIQGAPFGDPAAAIYLAYNAWSGPVSFTIPAAGPGKSWTLAVDSSQGVASPATIDQTYSVNGRSVIALVAK
jgi:isoamylase